MKQKVIYVAYVRLSNSYARDFCVDCLIARGVNVEYWDVVSLVFGEDEHSSKQTDYLRTPRTYNEIDAMVRLPENKDALYIMMLTYEIRTAKLYKLLSKHDCRMFSIMWGMMPINSDGKLQKIFLSLLANPARFVRTVFNKVVLISYRKLKLVKPLDVVFAAGEALATGAHYAAKVVPINIVDYDHYVRVKSDADRTVEGRYAVFLDTYLPYHPDLKILGLPPVDPRQYYLMLNKFFNLLEEKYGIKVVIAAHPKSDYSVEPFQGREIYRNMTPELARDADFVISHQSTSLGYAVLNLKPIIFIYTNEMMLLYKDTLSLKEMQGFAQYLNAAIYNIDEITQGDQIVIDGVDEKRYEDYKYNFLTTHESEDTTTQEIFWREINID